MKLQAQRLKDKLWVQYQGRVYALSLVSKSAASGASTDASTEELVAPFSCKVLKIHVNTGQKVKKGDPVIVVEAMKMEYSYASPRDGEIAEVLVKVGAIVPEETHFVRWVGAKK